MSPSNPLRERLRQHYMLVSVQEGTTLRNFKTDPIDWYHMHPDYGTRLLVMSALLYYRFDSPVITDADNDKLCQYLSEPDVYATLSPLRKWQLGELQSFRSSTSKVRVTTMAYHGALTWHDKCRGIQLVYPEPNWRFDKDHQIHFIEASDPL